MLVAISMLDEYCLILCQKASRVILEPFVLTKIYWIDLLKDLLDLFSKYILKNSLADSPNGISLSLEPFPSTFTIDLVRSTSENLRLINSLTLIPVAYKSSSIALSLHPINESCLGAFKRRSTSSLEIDTGNFFSCFGEGKSLKGFSEICPFFNKNKKNAFKEEIFLLTVLLL